MVFSIYKNVIPRRLIRKFNCGKISVPYILSSAVGKDSVLLYFHSYKRRSKYRYSISFSFKYVFFVRQRARNRYKMSVQHNFSSVTVLFNIGFEFVVSYFAIENFFFENFSVCLNFSVIKHFKFFFLTKKFFTEN